MTDGPLQRYDQAWSVLEHVLSMVGPGQWSNQTPCAAWDVRALVNHLVSSNLMVAAMARGEKPPPTADNLGPDLIAALHRTTASTREELSRPGVFERVTLTPMGEVPGLVLVIVRIVDMFVHAWDIAVATGQPTDLDPDLAAYVIGLTETMTERPEGGAFGPALRPPPDASPADQLAAFLGRSVPD